MFGLLDKFLGKAPDPQPPPPPVPHTSTGITTPMSDSGVSFGSVSAPFDIPGGRGRRGSNASTQPPSPVDVDLSHLSVEERAQIEAVIAKAKELHEEEKQRVR